MNSKPNSIIYKYKLSDVYFHEIDVNRTRNLEVTACACVALNQKYIAAIPIAEGLAVIRSLLNTGFIPQNYKHFINDLPSTSRQRNNAQSEEDFK